MSKNQPYNNELDTSRISKPGNFVTSLDISIKVRHDPDIVYEFIQNADYFPNYLSGIKKIRITNILSNKLIRHWDILIANKNIKWKEECINNDKEKTIIFKMTEGDFKNYDGFWKIEKDGAGSKLRFSITIDWRSTSFNKLDIPYLERKTRYAILYMLKKIRDVITANKVLIINQPQEIQDIVSDKHTYKNRYGKNVVGFHDHIKNISPKRPFIVIAPAYSETKRESLFLSYYLAKNGFNVFRYDSSNHIGESEGDALSYTLTGAKEEIRDTLDFLENKFDVKNFGIVCKSLAKRVAIKAASEDDRIHFIFSIVGIVDLRDTLAKVHQEDIMGRIAQGYEESRETIETFGFEVNMDFARNAIRDKFFDLATTKEDLSKINIPMIFLVSAKDAWVNIEDVQHLFDFSHNIVELIILPETMHQIYENPATAKKAMRMAVISAIKYLEKKIILNSAIREPSKREIIFQNKREKNDLKKTFSFTKKDEKDFWNWYLTNYSIIGESDEFLNLLKKIYEILEIQPSEAVLDAGCGIGLFGKWLIDNKPNLHITYIGLDYSDEIIEKAKRKHNSVPNRKNMDRIYIVKDLDYDISMEPQSISKICCNLVLSYVKDPVNTLKMFYKILKDNGRIAISSLKPYSDLSNLYLKFVGQIDNIDKAIEAKNLFNEAGKIMYKEKIGHYVFYEEDELGGLLLKAGFKNIQTYKMFDNQITLATGNK